MPSSLDDKMLLPIMRPVVFIGKNLEPGDTDRCIFKMLSRIEAGSDGIRGIILTLMLFSSLVPRERRVMSAPFTN